MKVDSGQSAYVQCSRTIFSDNTFSFCSPDGAVVRNCGVCCGYGDATAERVNASHGYCHYSAGIMFVYTSKSSISDCTMYNLTSTAYFDTIAFQYHTRDSVLSRLIYVLCENPKSGSPIYQSNYKLTFQNSVFIRCTNFDSSYYSDKSNIHKTTGEIDSLLSKQRECPKRRVAIDSLKAREKHISLVVTLMMSLIQLHSRSNKIEEISDIESNSRLDNKNKNMNLRLRLSLNDCRRGKVIRNKRCNNYLF